MLGGGSRGRPSAAAISAEGLGGVGGSDAQLHERDVGAGGLRGHGDGEAGIAGVERDAFGDGARGGVGYAEGDGASAGGELAGAAEVGSRGKEEGVAGEPLGEQGAGDFALALEEHVVDGGAVDGEGEGFAHAGVVEARGEDEGEHAHRRGGPDATAGRLAAQLVGAEFHDVGFTEVEIAGLVAQRAPHLDFDAVEKGAAAGGVFVGFVDGEASGFPARDGKAGAEQRRRVRRLRALADFDAQGSAVLRARRGVGGRRAEQENTDGPPMNAR